MADKKPYIFISYAHKDKKRVLPVIAELQERGYAVWYDAGIEAGSEWPRIIAERLSGCAMMIAFVSENYVVSGLLPARAHLRPVEEKAHPHRL